MPFAGLLPYQILVSSHFIWKKCLSFSVQLCFFLLLLFSLNVFVVSGMVLGSYKGMVGMASLVLRLVAFRNIFKISEEQNCLHAEEFVFTEEAVEGIISMDITFGNNCRKSDIKGCQQ